jgi:hypothetical protein
MDCLGRTVSDDLGQKIHLYKAYMVQDVTIDTSTQYRIGSLFLYTLLMKIFDLPEIIQNIDMAPITIASTG